MSKKETIVLSIIVIFLIIINIINYVKREQLRKNTAIIVEEMAVRIPINRAWTEELELLPGVGPALAERIIVYREKHGEFKTLSDLKNVKGIGDKVLQKIKPFIKL